MFAYQTPGVYYERIDAGAPGIAALRTDVTGFVGIALRGPLHTAVPVQSWRQFQSYFGDFSGAAYLAYAVRAFFENGGRRCWVVRVASAAAATAQTLLRSASNQAAWSVMAMSPGVWGNGLDILLRETHRAQTMTEPRRSTPEFSTVAAVTGFSRATHVRLSQDGSMPLWKVVSAVDAVNKRLFWVDDRPETRLPYDAPLTQFDPDRPILIETVEYTLIVREQGRLLGVYERLSLLPEHPRYGPSVLAPLRLPPPGTPSPTLPATPEPVVIQELRELAAPLALLEPLAVPTGFPIPLIGGIDGLLGLRADDFVGEPISPLDSDESQAHKRLGLRVLEQVDEIAIVAAPDIHIQPIVIPPKAPLPPCIPDPCLPPPPPAPAAPREAPVGELPPVFSEADIYRVQSALVQQCEQRRDRIALLDPPFAAARDDALGLSAVRAWRSRFDSQYAAFYYPWIKVVNPLRSPTALTRPVPPSGHVAGFYAQSDFQVGVHKAPANGPLVWTEDVTIVIDDAAHGLLNPAGINVIRSLPGRGIRIFGARTVSSDTDWRFVNVRRLLMMIEKAIAVAIQWAVFEPNNTLTRAKLNLTLTSFLLALWQTGALTGATANEAFFVKCDEANNPPDERNNGRLLAEVGVAPSQPFEFIVLRIGRTNNEFEISEANSLVLPSGAR